jgi:hypothetical protein
MAGRERVRGRRVEQRLRERRVGVRRPLAADRELQQPRRELRGQHRRDEGREDEPTAHPPRDERTDREPQKAERADERQRLEGRVERLEAVLDDPALEVAIDAQG